MPSNDSRLVSSSATAGWTSEWELVTPETADRWRTHHRFPRQRALIAAHIDMLTRAILNGEFESGTIVFYDTPEGTFLTDGQHRLDAIVRSERAVYLNVVHRCGS